MKVLVISSFVTLRTASQVGLETVHDHSMVRTEELRQRDTVLRIEVAAGRAWPSTRSIPVASLLQVYSRLIVDKPLFELVQ